ncbi:MAG: DUF3488 domain-containing protein [Candidatus Schekmanbacteria bacterium]|nr:DUF3488 domain-containing protein [Candidatus Schekmanbacteria bacterium]
MHENCIARRASRYLLVQVAVCLLYAGYAEGMAIVYYLLAITLAGLALCGPRDPARTSGWRPLSHPHSGQSSSPDTAPGLVVVTLAICDWAVLSQSAVLVACHTLSIIIVIRSLQARTTRNTAEICICSFFVFAGASLLISGIEFAVFFVLYAAGLLGFLAISEAHRLLRASDSTYSPSSIRLPVLPILASLGLTTILYPLVPRFGLGAIQVPVFAGRLSGFSESIQLGDMGQLLLNRDVMLRVRSPAPVYLRGRAFDHYNGRGWEATTDRRWPVATTEPGTFDFRRPGLPLPSAVGTIAISTERYGSAVLFVPTAPLRADIPVPILFHDEEYAVYAGQPITSGLDYTLSYDTERSLVDPTASPPASRGRTARLTRRQLDRYLDTSEASSRVHNLGRQVVSAAGASDEWSRANAILLFLRSGYAYSLEHTHEPGVDPLDEFLFTTKSGHCEYFATAAVLLFRSVGLPARLVSGFSGGERNDIGNYYAVLQSNAHTWAEVYFSGYGWLGLDPSPAFEAAAKPSSWAPLRWLHAFWDAMQFNWHNRVLGISRASQRELWRRLGQLVDRRARLLATGGAALVLLAAVLGGRWRLWGSAPPGRRGASPDTRFRLASRFLRYYVHLSLANWWWRFARIFPGRRHRRSESQGVRLYEELTAELSQVGCGRLDHECPFAYLGRIESTVPFAGNTARRIICAYVATRFGSAAISSAALGFLHDELTTMRKKLRTHKRRNSKGGG